MTDLLVALLVGAFPVLLGAAFVRRGLRERREQRAFTARAASAQALVVGLAERRHEGEERAVWEFHPVLRFPGPEGQPVEVESAVGATRPPARAGDTVEVLYDPADPATARLAAPVGPALTPDALVAAGVGLAATGLLVVLLFA